MKEIYTLASNQPLNEIYTFQRKFSLYGNVFSEDLKQLLQIERSHTVCHLMNTSSTIIVCELPVTVGKISFMFFLSNNDLCVLVLPP